jgi:hypothetical protein
MVVAKALRDDMIAFLSQTLVSVDRAADPSQRTGERRETLHRVSVHEQMGAGAAVATRTGPGWVSPLRVSSKQLLTLKG